MRRILSAGACAIALVIATATPAAADGHKLAGTITITSGLDDTGVPNAKIVPCDGASVSSGFSDLSAGTVVKVRNDKGKTIATGALKQGHIDSSLNCIFKFSVTVPDASLYTIEVSHRGELAYPKKKLEKAHWKIDLALDGSDS